MLFSNTSKRRERELRVTTWCILHSASFPIELRALHVPQGLHTCILTLPTQGKMMLVDRCCPHSVSAQSTVHTAFCFHLCVFKHIQHRETCLPTTCCIPHSASQSKAQCPSQMGLNNNSLTILTVNREVSWLGRATRCSELSAYY